MTLTPQQACRRLQVSVSTIRRYVLAGKLPAYRVAGIREMRFRAADVDALLEPIQRAKT